MSGVIKYAALTTKIASMSGKFLTADDYKQMISLKSPSEIAMYLKNQTVYSQFFAHVDVGTLHRDAIERLLKESLVNYMDKIIHYFNGKDRQFIQSFYLKYEVDDLKRVARLISIDKDYDHLRDKLVFAGRYRYLNVEQIVKAKSLNELIQALSGTVYEPFLRNFLDRPVEGALYRLEMSLDKTYFSVLHEGVKHLSLNDRQVFYELYGSWIDMLNLQWIYRGKKYYNLLPEEIFNYTLNRGRKFDYRKIKQFCYARDIEDFVSQARTTPYAFMFKGDPEQDVFMERRMNRYMYFRLKSALHRFRMDISPVLAYLALIEFEMRDIISLIENVRYRMGYDEAQKYLIKAI